MNQDRGPLRWSIGMLSVAVGMLLATTLYRDPYQNPDSHAFEAIARSILRGEGISYVEPMLPTVRLFAFRNPLYPVLMSLPLALGGVTLVLMFQGALVGLTTLGVAAIARRIAGVRAAWWAWGLAMLWPATWSYSGQLMSEVLYIALAVVAVERTLAALATQDRRAMLLAAGIAGAAAGASMLARSPGVAVALPLLLLTLRRPPAAVALAFGALLVWTPWPVRNMLRLHAFVPLATNGQMNFFAGNSDVGVGACWDSIATRQELGELGFERYFAERTRTEVLTQPIAFARRIAVKAVAHVLPTRRELTSVLLWLADLVILASMVRDPGTIRRLFVPLAIFGTQWAIQALTVVGPRYRHPTDWLVLLVLAVCISSWWTPRPRAEAR